MTNTPPTPTVENRLSTLERSNSRWRLGAIGASALLAGILIGGMGQPDTAHPNTAEHAMAPAIEQTPKDVVGVAGTDDTIFRIHRDGSITYLKTKNGNRTAKGIWDWGDVLIDHKYRNIDKR